MRKPKLIIAPEYLDYKKDVHTKYTVEENLRYYPELRQSFKRLQKEGKTRSPASMSFDNIFKNQYSQPMFDIRNASIYEPAGQRNCLIDDARRKKVLAIGRDFDPYQFEPVSIDWVVSIQEFLIRDGGGRSHAAYLNGIYEVPACVRVVKDLEHCRRLFADQDKNRAAISEYEKFELALANPNHNDHHKSKNLLNISQNCGFSLHTLYRSSNSPYIAGLGQLRRIIQYTGGDHHSVNWKAGFDAPHLCDAVEALKGAFPEEQELPTVVVAAVTAFLHVAHNRMPRDSRRVSRLTAFLKELKNNQSETYDLSPAKLANWSRIYDFESSNNPGSQGAASLMGQWNKFMVVNNKQSRRSGFYRYAKFDITDINYVRQSSYARTPILGIDPTLAPF